MMQTIFSWILIVIWALIPIILWGYLFSYFDNNQLNRKKFFLGIFAGIVSVFPVLMLKEYGDFFQNLHVNIFSYVANLDDWKSVIGVFFSFFVLLFLVSLFPFFLTLRDRWRERGELFWKNMLVFSWFLLGITILFLVGEYFFSYFSGLNFWVEKDLRVGEIVFNSLKLVIFYYIIIAWVEELSKFFCFKYAQYFTLTSVREGVIFSIFVALGFSFFENILYFRSIYDAQWLGQSMVGVYISRNIFSVVLHVLCSSLFAYFFSQAYLKFRTYFHGGFLKILFQWFFLALLLHGMFNIFLTLDVTFFIFIYLIGTYFYLTYILYEWEER